MRLIIRITFAATFMAFSFCAQTVKEPALQETKAMPPSQVNLTGAQFKSAGIELGKMEPREIGNTIKANGILAVPPQNMVTVSAVLGGFIKHTKLLQGMWVSKGEVIAVMEHPNYIQLQQDYLESKSQLTFYDFEYKRQLELAKENINAIKTLQQAQSNYQSTKAKVEGLKAKLNMINISVDDLENGSIHNTVNIYAPLSGFVTQVFANVGMYANPADVLFKIVDTKHLHAEVLVFEKDILKININQRVRIQLANESIERAARVYLIGKEISPDRTVRIHCHLEKEDSDLLPGMYFSALFESGTGSVSTLPERAVVNFEGQDYAFLVVNESAHQYRMIKVIKGVTESGYTEITIPDEGINLSALFVVNGAYDLLSYLKNTEEE